MAGGTFDKLVGKVRPGTYIKFVSTRHDPLGISDRGTVVIPLLNHDYGPVGEYIELTRTSPDAAIAKLGYSIYDSDPKRQMLLIREAFKKAQKVLVYRVNQGTAATASQIGENEDLTATAKYPGTRGNQLSVAIVANPVGGFDVIISLGGEIVVQYERLSTVKDLIDKDCPYITFTGTGELKAVAGVTLAGGTDKPATNGEVTSFLDTLEGKKFNVLCLPTTEDELHAACKTKIQYLREDVGRGVQAVLPKTKSGDYEGIINVTNSVKLGDNELSVAEACAWVAAATAGAGNTVSNTYVAYDGATEIVGAKTHEEAVEAINKGEFFFSLSENGEVVVEYDINSLVTFNSPKDSTYRKNRVIRVFDTFAEAIQNNFPPNKFDNAEIGWNIMEGIGRSILKQFYEAGALTNVDYDNDFLVDREASYGDQTFFDVGIQPVDSAEKLYFTISTR